ncbi:MAG TPA: spermidine/putrescine ABC transporter substrate-binding protein [Bryobacteraceae bacterium]|nr:spermidine/putrescine ABC transporter substrate-binding protein [Bryobacteraceae bacterium]
MTRRSLLLAAAGAAGCGGNRARRLNVFNWSEYVAPETISNFEREFRVRVRYATYESAEEMLAKASTGNSGWDVVFPSNSYIQPMASAGLLARLDHKRLPNLAELEPFFQSPPWDASLSWSVPYMHSSTGIVYDASVSPPPVGWRDFLSERFRGRVTMLDDPNEVIGACLKQLGYSLNSCDPAQLAQARNLALEQKRHLRAYLNAEVREQLVAGDVLMAQLWATTAQIGIDARPSLTYVYPIEGFALYADCAVILRESDRVELAHEFINYLLRPQVSARIAAAMRTATPSAGARRLLPPSLRNNPTLYPPPETLARGEWFTALPPAGQRLRDRIWTEIKTA